MSAGRGPARRDSLRIVVAGRLAGTPGQGGATWAVLQYLLGLRALGHSVLFVQPIEEDGLRADGTADGRLVEYFERVVRRFGLDGAAALIGRDGTTIGASRRALERRAADAELLLNLSGVLSDPDILERIPVRAYLDLDPAFTQLWQDADRIDMGFEGHTHFATVGLEIGRPGCGIPTCGRRWLRFVPPVCLDEWPRAEGRPARRAWTTVANWRAYGSITHEGVFYGQKAHAIRELIDLPSALHDPVELALTIHPDERGDLASLREAGWRLLPPSMTAGTPDRYRDFIAGSAGELGLAKSGYVVSGSGWFSDRSACYLASGRPVLAQDTGFGAHLPTGLGLLSFRTRDEAAAASEAVRREYERHARAARELARDLFAAERVLPALLHELGGPVAAGEADRRGAA